MKIVINSDKAPTVIGPYSRAVKVDSTIYISGQIPLDPFTNEIVKGDIHLQVTRVFENLRIIVEAAGGTFDSIVRVGIYLVHLEHFDIVNSAMTKYFSAPYPARTTIGVTALPKGALVEVDAVMELAI